MSDQMPAWLKEMDGEDYQFIQRFILASGSLKELAQVYSVSYPTVRARLDRLIAKVEAADSQKLKDPFERKVKVLVADGKLSVAVAKELLSLHQSAKKSAETNSRSGA